MTRAHLIKKGLLSSQVAALIKVRLESHINFSWSEQISQLIISKILFLSDDRDHLEKHSCG